VREIVTTCDVCKTESRVRYTSGEFELNLTGRITGYVNTDLCMDCAANARSLLIEAHQQGQEAALGAARAKLAERGDA
jgi:hypothetical protein